MSKVLELLDAMNKGKITNQDVIDILTKSDEKLQDKVATLEAKLAQAKMNESFEKEKKDNAFKFIEELKQQLIEECKEHQEFCKVADEKVKELKQQLAEKDEEIDKLKTILSMQAIQVSEEQRLNLITTNCIQYNPNQTAIAELENVIELIKEHYNKQFPDFPLGVTEQIHIGIIDQRIKSLKGETDGSTN